MTNASSFVLRTIETQIERTTTEVVSGVGPALSVINDDGSVNYTLEQLDIVRSTAHVCKALQAMTSLYVLTGWHRAVQDALRSGRDVPLEDIRRAALEEPMATWASHLTTMPTVFAAMVAQNVVECLGQAIEHSKKIEELGVRLDTALPGTTLDDLQPVEAEPDAAEMDSFVLNLAADLGVDPASIHRISPGCYVAGAA